jgi:transcriptional regulator with XRE-family HTH domain
MVTRGKPQHFFLREWRQFMGTKAIEIADALGIERESYYRLERETWRINVDQVPVIAKTLGIRPDQLWFHPPTPDAKQAVSLDDLPGVAADFTSDKVDRFRHSIRLAS